MLTNQQDPQTRVLNDLSSMILHILRYPPPTFPATFSPELPSASSSSLRRSTTSLYYPSHTSPASFACFFLGISLTLMLIGSVIFVIGFLLMPWIIGLVLVLYFAGFMNNLSSFGRDFVNWSLFHHDYHGWKYL